MRTQNILDFAVIDMRLNISTNHNGHIPAHTYDSDHKAIEITCNNYNNNSNNIHIDTINRNSEHRFNFNNTNWPLWQTKLEKHYNKYLHNNKITQIIPDNINITNNEINNNIEIITNLINENIKKTIPRIATKNNMECYMNNTIKKLYKTKSQYISLLKRGRRLNTLTQHQIIIIKSQIKLTNELIIQNIKIEINKRWTEHMENIKQGPKMFAQIKRITANNNTDLKVKQLQVEEAETHNMQQLNIDWTTAEKEGTKYNIYEQQENLNILGHFIQKTTIPDPQLGKPEHNNIILQTIDPLKLNFENNKINNITITNFNNNNTAIDPNNNNNNYFINTTQLTQILKCLNTKKSYGLDKLPCIALKHLPKPIIKELCRLFNHCLNNRIFPQIWKTAKIYPIHKKGKSPLEPKNYRPISLLSNLGKVLEIIIYDQIQDHISENSILPDNQFGFRYKHSTIHAITKLTSDICKNLNQTDCTGTILIDMEKAFESVWLDGLLYKMQKMNFNTNLLQLLYELLYGRHFKTTNGMDLSTRTFTIHNGLQQGSITAPVLFSLYTKALIESEQLNSHNIQTIAYADDIVIYGSSKKITTTTKNVQDAVNFAVDFLHTWRIKINVAKCETILFRKPYQLSTSDTRNNWKKFKIDIAGTTCMQTPSVKYLGVHLDKFLYMDAHIDKQLCKAKKIFFKNKNLFCSPNIMVPVKQIAYKSLVRPILTYGAPIWWNVGPYTMERLRLFERKCLRHCHGEFRTAISGYRKYITDKKLYTKYASDRIDLHILKLVRDHIKSSTDNRENSLIFAPYFTEDQINAKNCERDKNPGPETFVYLDAKGYIQDHDTRYPKIYHLERRQNIKGFDNQIFENRNHYQIHNRFNFSIPTLDPTKNSRTLAKYWWLNNPNNNQRHPTHS